MRQSSTNTLRSPADNSAATPLAISEAGISAAEDSSPGVADVAQNGTTHAGWATGGGPTSGSVPEPAPKAACPRASAGNEQGCSFFKTRRVRVRALTHAPDIARIAVGRVTAPSAAIATQNSAAKPPEAKPREENSASAAARADPASRAPRGETTKEDCTQGSAESQVDPRRACRSLVRSSRK